MNGLFDRVVKYYMTECQSDSNQKIRLIDRNQSKSKIKENQLDRMLSWHRSKMRWKQSKQSKMK